MDAYDWLLFLHVTAAFAVAAAALVFAVVALAPAPVSARLAPVAKPVWDAGGGGTLVFGIWLVANRSEFDFGDGWVIAGFALWLAAAITGNLYLSLVKRSSEGPRSPRAVALCAATAALVVAVVVVMIAKPGT